jgi:hypothetical protein
MEKNFENQKLLDEINRFEALYKWRIQKIQGRNPFMRELESKSVLDQYDSLFK